MDNSTLALFAQSMWVGLAIAAPVGPIGLLVIQRTLNHGSSVGLATGLGAALADMAYGAVGAWGVTGLIALLGSARVPLAVVGSVFLLWLAWRTWRMQPAGPAAITVARPGLLASFAATFFLTLANPATIVSFIAVFGALASGGAPSSPWPMVLGVGIGSALWWLLLSSGVGLLRSRFDAGAQRWVNRLSALLLAGFAVWQWALLLAASN